MKTPLEQVGGRPSGDIAPVAQQALGQAGNRLPVINIVQGDAASRQLAPAVDHQSLPRAGYRVQLEPEDPAHPTGVLRLGAIPAKTRWPGMRRLWRTAIGVEPVKLTNRGNAERKCSCTCSVS